MVLPDRFGHSSSDEAELKRVLSPSVLLTRKRNVQSTRDSHVIKSNETHGL